MKLRYNILGVFALLIAVVGGIALVYGGQPFLPPQAIDPALRTVVILTGGDLRPALKSGDIAVDLESGALPGGISRATVLTDQDCAADYDGVSHCLNELQVGQHTFAIRHHHKMMEEPCFSPTEMLNVVDVATYTTLKGVAQ